MQLNNSFKLLTWNLANPLYHDADGIKGIDIYRKKDGRYDSQQKTLMNQEPDIICLQEALTKPSGPRGFLSKDHCPNTLGHRHPEQIKTHQQFHYTLWREVLCISYSQEKFKMLNQFQDDHYLGLVLETNKTQINFINVHINRTAESNKIEYYHEIEKQKILEKLEKQNLHLQNTIVIGDWNSPIIQFENWDCYSVSEQVPDYAYVSKNIQVSNLSQFNQDRTFSDHLGLLLEFQII